MYECMSEQFYLLLCSQGKDSQGGGGADGRGAGMRGGCCILSVSLLLGGPIDRY